MGHPDSGRLQALLDDEVQGAEAQELRSHLAECSPCQGALERLEAASLKASLTLPLLDVEASLEDAAERFQARRSIRDQGFAGSAGRGKPARGQPGRRSFGTSLSLPRAASIALLLTGAVASALPGSPVRRWVVRGWDAFTSPAVAPSGQAGLQGSSGPGAVESPAGAPETGAAIPVQGGAVEIWIHRMPEDAELRVLWVDGAEAWVYAGEPTRFNRAEGRLEAFDPPGAVRVEIPRNAGQVTVGLDGEVILRKSGEELEIRGPVQQRTPSEIRFGPSGSPNDGRG